MIIWPIILFLIEINFFFEWGRGRGRGLTSLAMLSRIPTNVRARIGHPCAHDTHPGWGNWLSIAQSHNLNRHSEAAAHPTYPVLSELIHQASAGHSLLGTRKEFLILGVDINLVSNPIRYVLVSDLSTLDSYFKNSPFKKKCMNFWWVEFILHTHSNRLINRECFFTSQKAEKWWNIPLKLNLANSIIQVWQSNGSYSEARGGGKVRKKQLPFPEYLAATAPPGAFTFLY